MNSRPSPVSTNVRHFFGNTLRRVITSISQRHFDGQEALFPEVAEGFVQLLTAAKKLVGIYNEALAGDIERLEGLLGEGGDGQVEPPLTIDLAGLIGSGQGAGCLHGGHGKIRGAETTWRVSSSV